MHGLTTVEATGRTGQPRPSSRSAPRWGSDLWWYAGAVATGSALIVAAAVNQPYNENEIQQILPYGSSDIATITGGTRQPPLDPLLGALVQHLLGAGQLRQRLTAVLAGIGTLVVLGLFLRRLALRYAGAFALWVLATQPLLVQYSAYARPYALPVFLSVLFVYAAHLWMAERRIGGLLVAVLAACALPLTRVPEPNTFLIAVATALAWYTWRGRFSWAQTVPLIAPTVAAVAFIGYPMYRALLASGPSFDPSPAGVASRFGTGVAELVTHVLPRLGDWFPWWPITLAVIIAALALPESRQALLGRWGWAWWPLLSGPVVSLLAYHFMNPVGFEARPYRDRYAYFFLPAFCLLVAALAGAVRAPGRRAGEFRVALGGLLAAALLAQLPATAGVITTSVAPDFPQAGRVLADTVPADATVVYLTPDILYRWRQGFMDLQIDTESMPSVADSRDIAKHPRTLRASGPVYVLVLAGECANSVYCDKPAPSWDHQVPGWQVAQTFDRFTLYEPTAGQSRRSGVVDALLNFSAAFGPEYGMLETYAAAGVLKLQGDGDRGRLLIRQALSALDPVTRQLYREYAKQRRLNPF